MNNTQTHLGQLESTASILHLPANYEAALTQVVSESLIVLRGLDTWVRGFKESGVSMQDYMTQHHQMLGDTFSDTAKRVANIIGIVPGILDGLEDFSGRDRQVFARANTKFSHVSATDEIQNASSPQAKALFEAELQKKFAASSRTNNQRQQRRSRQTPPPSDPNQYRAPSVSAYDQLMSTLRASPDRGAFKTMGTFQEGEVVKVINTVNALRAKDPEITDKEIAIRYARRSNNNPDANIDHKRATQIVMILMGGKVSGKLPF